MKEQQISEKQEAYTFKVKAAAAVTGINTLLTGIKFLLYYFSGSMAILAEAWHSFADIATSLFVLIALVRGKQQSELSQSEPKVESRKKDAELLISFGIGILLAGISCRLIIKFFSSEPGPIENSLVSGLIFLVFSFVSYFIYRFETQIGEKENSIGLISDGMHARADMTASLITGFALILYTMGLNIDRWVAGLIAFFILSFAIETIVNVVVAFYRDEADPYHRYRSSRIISILFNKQAFQEKSKSLQSFVEKRFKSTRLIKNIHITFLGFPLLLIVGFCLYSIFFTVGIREKAVIERFGKPVDLKEPTGPGLHIKCPWPIDRVVKVKTSFIEEMNVGNIINRQSSALLWTKSHGSEEPFLSGDNNFFYPYIVLHYRIKDVFLFFYKNVDPKTIVNEVAHQIATHVFAQQAFYDIASTNREKLEQDIFLKLQVCLDNFETGIELVSVNFKDIHPPISVADSFERVIAGYQEKQKTINDALGYKYDVVPESRGNAAKEMEAAKAYIKDRIRIAEGTSRKFIMSLPGTKNEKDVMTSRIYLENIKSALKDKRKIVIDPKTGKPDIWMDFEGLVQKDKKMEKPNETFSDY